MPILDKALVRTFRPRAASRVKTQAIRFSYPYGHMESTIKNQRLSGRVEPRRPEVHLHGIQETPVPAMVLDESFGGLGVAAPATDVSIGMEIEVELSFEPDAVRSLAVIRHVTPLPSGCWLGIEWRAQALSRQLRDLAALSTHGGHHELAKILPGGLCMMWKYFEAGRWEHLVSSAERLKKEAAAADVTNLIPPIERFQDAVRQLEEVAPGPDEVAQIRSELDELIRRCIDAVEQAA